jgi:hypothetical protein
MEEQHQPILSSETTLHKGHDQKDSVEKMLVISLKGLVGKTN